MTDPKVYVACLSSYNAGRLFGEWIPADQGEDELGDRVQAMLARSPEPNAEEFRIDDHEGFGGINVGGESLDVVARLGELIVEHGADIVSGAYDYGADSITDYISNAYMGHYDSEADYAESCFDTSTLDKFLGNYIDWTRVARDMFIDSVHSTPSDNGGVHVWLRI